MDENNERRKAWTYFGILFAYKLWTAVLVFVFFAWTAGNLNLVIMMHAMWIAVILAVIAIPALYYYRLVRARAKRERLKHSEWHTDGTPMPLPTGKFAFLRRIDQKRLGTYLLLLPGPPAAIFHFMHGRFGPGVMATFAFFAVLLVFHTNILKERPQQAGQRVRSDEAERRSRYD